MKSKLLFALSLVGVLTACGGRSNLNEITPNEAVQVIYTILDAQSGAITFEGNVIAGEINTINSQTRDGVTQSYETNAEFGYDIDQLFYYTKVVSEGNDSYMLEESYYYYMDGKLTRGRKYKLSIDDELVEEVRVVDAQETQVRAEFEQGKSEVINMMGDFISGIQFIDSASFIIPYINEKGVDVYFGSDGDGSLQFKADVDATLDGATIKAYYNVYWNNYLLSYVDAESKTLMDGTTVVYKASGEVTDSFKISYPTWNSLN